MQLSIRNAAGRSEPVEKQMVAGRTVLRLKHGDRLEIVDPATGAAPAGVKAHRGGANGNDLIIEHFGETVLIEGFFEQNAQGEAAVAIEFPGGNAPEITPATPELEMPGAVLDTGFSMAGDTGYATLAQATGAAVSSAGAGASTAAASSGAAAAAAAGSNMWWIAGGIAGAGAAGAAIEHNSSNDDKGGNEETPPAPQPPAFALEQSADAVDEGETVTFTLNTTNVAPGTQYTYTISGVSAGDVQGGLLTGVVTIDANGQAVIQISLRADLTTEGLENLTVAVAGQTASVAINDVSTTPVIPEPPVPTFELGASSDSVDEGEGVSFTLDTTNVAPGTQYSYTITGISPADIVGGAAALTGVVTIDANGRAVIEIHLAADATTEGLENLTVAVAGQTASVAINDVSTTPVIPEPTFELSASSDSVDEGEGVSFTLDTTNVAPGTQYSYTITGISPADIVGGAAALTGVVTIDANGRAVIEIHLAADATTEGLETLTLQIAGQTIEVDIRDVSVTPAFVLTAGQDNVTGTSWDDTINGSNVTYNAGDVINGGAGHDQLNLTLPGGTLADGVKVSNVEQVNLQATAGSGGVELSMTGFDASVTHINIDSARADVTISDQQSLAAVSITDVSGSTIALDYDSQIVSGDADTLALTVDEFTGTLNVDQGIEAIDVQVKDGVDEASALTLTAEGATNVTVSGGIAGQSVAFDIAMNGERAAGATFDATQFAGNVVLTNVGGGDRQFAYAVEFTQGLQVGQSAMLTIDGHEYSVTAASTALSASELVQQFMLEIYGDYPQHTHNELAANGYALIVYGISDPVSVTAQIADVAMNVRDTFDYSEFGGTSSDVVAPVVNSEISNLRLGAGDDVVTVMDSEMLGNDISYGDNYDLGDGNNTLVVALGDVHGTVSFGTGNGSMAVGEDIGAAAQVSFGVGDSVLAAGGDIKANASVSFQGGNNTVAASNVLDDASIVFNGDGDNTLDLEREVVSFVPVDEYGRIAGNASVSFNGDGNNELIAGDILDNATVRFGDGDNRVETGTIEGHAVIEFGDGDNVVEVRGEDSIRDAATLTFGDGDNQLSVGRNIQGEDTSVSFGDGANTVTVGSDVKGATLTFGAGDNTLTVDGSIESASVSFGSGDNTVAIDSGFSSSTLTSGDGADSVSVDEDVRGSTIQLGGGEDSLYVDNVVRHGSQIDLGSGNDTLAMGDGTGEVEIRSGAESAAVGASVVSLGEGDDTATIVTGNEGNTGAVVRSGGYLQGGEGNDVLTIKAVDDIEQLVARTEAQEVRVTFDSDYTLVPVVSVTIDGTTYSYTVLAADIVQGDAVATQANVVAGLVQVITTAMDSPLLAANDGNQLHLTGVQGQADVEVSSGHGTVEELQMADAGISGFETLNLVALNPLEGDDGNDDDAHSGDIAVDFALVSDVEQIDLKSEVTLGSSVEQTEGIVNGAYTTHEAGDTVVFSLTNLQAGLGEHISVSGNEVTATGNRQVSRINIGPESGDHQIGDVITLTIDDVDYSITVTADDLAGATAQDDANNIATRLASVIAAGEHGFTVARDGNIITLIGSADCNADIDFCSMGEDSKENLQSASAVDDRVADVTINAVLSAEADTDNDTLVLDINGTGNFDLAIDGEWDGMQLLDSQPGPAYENLTLNVRDSFSHYINTDDNGDDDEFVGGTVTLTGGAVGASIVIDEVMAKTVTSTSAANVEVIFDKRADEGEDEDYAFTVTMQGGDDVVDMEGVIFSSRSTIDLGAGVDRLIIGNGFTQADLATGLSSALDQGLMFRNVSNVEELEFRGEDSITFEDDAFEAGFEKLIVGADSIANLVIANGFERDLAVELGDDVINTITSLDYAHALTVTTGDNVISAITLGEDSASEVTLTGEDRNTVTVTQAGDGDVTAVLDDNAVLMITNVGDGDVAATVDRKGTIVITQSGSGNVATSAGAKSTTAITFTDSDGIDSTADVAVVQTTSDENIIALANLTAGQNVTVDITLAGGEDDDAVVADLELEAYEGETDLDVTGDFGGGIDKLTLRSDAERGSSSSLGVAVADSWAVGDGEDATVDMTIDASIVQAEYVLINASQEDDANLSLTGSATATNVILGGGLGDTIKGGASWDILQGDRIDGLPQVSTVGFATSYDAGDVITLTIDGQTITAVIGEEYTDPVSGDVIAAAFASYINGGVDDSSDHITFTGGALAGAIVDASAIGWSLTLTGEVRGEDFTVSATVDSSNDLGPSAHVIEFTPVGLEDGEMLQIVFNGGNTTSVPFSIDLATTLANYVYYQGASVTTLTGGTIAVNDNGDGLILTGLPDGTPLSHVALEARVVDGMTGMIPMGSVTIDETEPRGAPADQIDPVVSTPQAASDGSIEGIASDTLEGGEGRDLYLFAESQLDTMDTIVGLNLGGATHDTAVDSVALGVFVQAGDFTTLIGAPGSNFQTQNQLEVEAVVNNGQAANLTGATLEDAVATLFQNNGWFEQGESADTNAAGLFNWGGDTYLIAVGETAGSSFGADDYIVKVTGATGTLDLSDFYQMVG